MQPKDDEMKWNHKKKAKDRFLLFCETVLNHERELLSEVRFFFIIFVCENFSSSLYFDFSAINRH